MAYQLQTSVPLMDGSASSSLLMTPKAIDGDHPGIKTIKPGQSMHLSAQLINLLPTPTVQDASNTAGPSQLDRNSLPLNTIVTLLPTPAVNDMGAGKTVEHWDEWTAAMQAKHGNGNGHGKSLAIEGLRIGASTPSPSTAGNTSSDAVRLPLPSQDQKADNDSRPDSSSG